MQSGDVNIVIDFTTDFVTYFGVYLLKSFGLNRRSDDFRTDAGEEYLDNEILEIKPLPHSTTVVWRVMYKYYLAY